MGCNQSVLMCLMGQELCASDCDSLQVKSRLITCDLELFQLGYIYSDSK